jgi:hypothetical protein
MKTNIAILFLAAFVFASCNSTSTSTSNNNNNGGGGGAPANTMYITVGGKTDTLVVIATKTTSSNQTVISVSGGNTAGVGSGFSLTNISSAGTYSVGVIGYSGGTISGVPDMLYSYKDNSGSSVSYVTSSTGTTSDGTLIVTAISATSVQATFSNCTLTLQSGSGPQTAIITSGSVNATIQ